MTNDRATTRAGAPIAPEPADRLGPAQRRFPRDAWLGRSWRLAQRSVWRYLPEAIRGRVREAGRVLVPHARNAPPAGPVCVVGRLSSRSGLGEGARLMAEALHAIGHDVRTVDVPKAGSEPRDPHAPPLERGQGMLVIHAGPDSLRQLLPMLGRSAEGKRVVGNWTWELDTIPAFWIPAMTYVDEVWSPSEFVASAVRRATEKTVRVVPFPVAIVAPGRRCRPAFGIAEEKFVVLSVFAAGSCFERKNPLATVQAFQQAFGNTPGAELILKVPDLNTLPIARQALQQAIGSSGNIRVIDAEISRSATRDLIASADVVLSLHRAEGFGLVLAEAMHSGTAVIASNWSGNLDFMTTDTAGLVDVTMIEVNDPYGQWTCPGRWADPDVAHAASLLQRFARHPDHVQPMKDRARALVAERLGLAHFRAATAPALPPI